jgi:hypothetical protein
MHCRKTLAIALVAAATGVALPARGILIRPDREDAKYLELGEQYPSSCLIGIPDGEGTLIAPRWVLTAAHIAKEVAAADPRPRPRIGTATYAIEEVYVHPGWKKRGPHDIALLKLARPVVGVEPTPICRGREEGGELATIVGHGYTGTLDKGPRPREKWDKKKRGATNTIILITNHPDLLLVRIQPPEKATELQGSAGPGDSGGPAFIRSGGKAYVAGVGVSTDDVNADGIYGNYGDREIYTRVSSYAEWIDRTMRE